MAVDQRTTGWNARYSFSGKERDRETGLSYFGARYYDSDLSIWLSVDPLADKLPHQSPYVYCSNNPIGRVDPDGMLDDDYFNQYGKYLGSDNSSTDKVRIIKQETWDQVKDNISYKGNDGSTVISSGAANAISQDASGADLSDRSALNIYQHYNPTDYNLIVGNGDYNMQTRAKDQLIAVNLKKNKGLKISDHFNEIRSIFIHEKQHIFDYESGFRGDTPARERRAVSTQWQILIFLRQGLFFNKQSKNMAKNLE